MSLFSRILAQLARQHGRDLTSEAPVAGPVTLPLPTSLPTHGPGPVEPTPTPTPTPTAPGTGTTTPTPTPTDPGTGTATPTPSPTPTDPNGTLVWSDEFSGPDGAAPNPKVWKYNPGGTGWGNNELECYTSSTDNAATDGQGDLVITARYQPNHQCTGGPSTTTNDYTSARLSTEHLMTMDYGKLRVRAELPSASGLWPAIWAMGDDTSQVGWPNGGEMDVAEVVGQSPSTVYGTIHGPGSSGQPYGIGGGYTLPSTVSSAFHVYGLDWTPDSISFSIDDHIYKTITRSQVSAQGQWVFNTKSFLLLNVAVGGNWPGTPKDNSVFPQQMKVDYVRVYK